MKSKKKPKSNGSAEPATGKSTSAAPVTQDKPFKPSETMKLITAFRLVTLVVMQRIYHWGKRIASNQTGMLYGPRGHGKTFFCLALAIAMATGAKFLGMKAAKLRRVIYLDGEMDLNSLIERVRKLSASLGVEPPRGLRIFTPEAFADLLPSVSDPAGLTLLDELIGTEWDILFLDNYSAWSRDGRETAEAWAPAMRWMLAHKRAGRTVIVVHHAGKSGEQRGSSRHEDALDWSVALKPHAEKIDDGALRFTLIWEKFRHLKSSEATPISVTMRTAEDGSISWEYHDGMPIDPRKAEAKAMKEKGQTDGEIARAFDVNRTTIRRWLEPAKT